MLTFLFALASIWTLFWLVMLLLDWDKHEPQTDSVAQRSARTDAITSGPASTKSTHGSDTSIEKNNNASAERGNNNAATKPATQDNVSSADARPGADKQGQANVAPLFDKPAETDDLKVIKGIGVVMEQTLNDLGITTFKQLAGFKQAEIKMVSDALSEQNAGFGDRIERDEWVDQAKDLIKS